MGAYYLRADSKEAAYREHQCAHRLEQGIRVEGCDPEALPRKYTVDELISWLHKADKDIYRHQLQIEPC